MTDAPRHVWGPRNAFLEKTERQCLKCGLVKVTRHPPVGLPWTEFWRGLDRIEGVATPPCERPPIDSEIAK